MNTPFRILSLDGGGSWAVLQLMTLRALYPRLGGRDILRRFDLVAANSGGALVLASLCEDLPPDQAIRYFLDEHTARRIFSKLSFWERFFPVDYTRAFQVDFGPKYSTKSKREALSEWLPRLAEWTFEDLAADLGPSGPRLLIPVMDALDRRTRFFRSWEDLRTSVLDVVHASSSPPLQYFDFPAVIPDAYGQAHYYWDGALGGFNNPVLAAVVEAMKLGVPPSRITALSLGTGQKTTTPQERADWQEQIQFADSTRRQKARWSTWGGQSRYLFGLIRQQAMGILQDPPDWSTYVAWMLLHQRMAPVQRPRLVRLSPLLHVWPEMPTGSQTLVKQLSSLDRDLTTADQLTLLPRLFHHWRSGRILNQPVAWSLAPDGSIEATAGHTQFDAAAPLWLP